MLMAYNVKPGKKTIIPAVTHVDGTARVQTVNSNNNHKYRELIEEFRKLTGIPMVLNTSFNTKGEPVVCSPENAVKTFMNSEMDTLIIGSFIVEKGQRQDSMREKGLI